MRVTITSRITVSIILVVITTVKERRGVAILILHSNVTSVDIHQTRDDQETCAQCSKEFEPYALEYKLFLYEHLG